VAQLDLGHALGVPDAGLLLALLGAITLTRHGDAQLALDGAMPNRLEEVGVFTQGSVMLGPHQQLHTAQFSLLVEEFCTILLRIGV
jgi:hypothetical protein